MPDMTDEERFAEVVAWFEQEICRTFSVPESKLLTEDTDPHTQAWIAREVRRLFSEHNRPAEDRHEHE